MSLQPDGIYVKKKEWILLAASRGLMRIGGIFSKEPEKYGEADIYQEMFQMLQDGLFLAEEEKLKMSPFVQEIFEDICKSKTFLRIYLREVRGLVVFCYLGKTLIWIEENRKNEEELLVRRLSINMLADEIYQQSWMPECAVKANLLEDFEEITEGEFEFADIGRLLENDGIRFMLEWEDISSGRVEKRLQLFDEGIYPELLLQTPQIQKKGCFSREKLFEYLQEV